MGVEREREKKDRGKKVAPVYAMEAYIYICMGSRGVAPFILNPGMQCG
jgi:hypothetical protein